MVLGKQPFLTVSLLSSNQLTAPFKCKEKDLGQLKGSQLADYRGKEIGYLFQNFELLDNLTAKERYFTSLIFAQGRCQRKQGSVKLLSQYLDISELLDKFPSQLSGGQRQRVAAAP